MHFSPWPYFEEDEIQAAANVLRSGNVNQWTGNEIISFEKEFADYIGVKYSIALANGSLGLDLALMALEIKKGDEVIVTPRSFIASVSCVALKGAIPVFVDVDQNSQNISLETISKAISPRTKAVIVVHLAGWTCEMDRIRTFCDENKIALIEDCAQAHGAMFKGAKAGSFGDCAIFSFCQDKIMTTGGEGGMLLTNKKSVWEKVWSYKDHGKKYKASFSKRSLFEFWYRIESFGTNCRMTEMQAAVGRVVLGKLDKWINRRRVFADLLNQEFKNVPGLRITEPPPDIFHSYYKYYVFLKTEELRDGWTQSGVIKSLNEKGIPCDAGICPEIYLEKAFAAYPFKIVDKNGDFLSYSNGGEMIQRLPRAKQLGEASLVFRVHPTLTTESIQYVVDQVKRVMKKAVR